MKSVGKKITTSMSLSLLLMIFVILGPLTGVDCLFAQGSWQGGQGIGSGGLGGLSGLGTGGMMGSLGVSMIGFGSGIATLSPLSIGFPMGVSGSVSMLGGSPNMTGVGIYGGSGGLYGFNGLYGGIYGGMGGLYGFNGLYGGMYGGMGGLYGFYGLYGGMYGGMGGLYGFYGLFGGFTPYSTLMGITGLGFFNPGVLPERQGQEFTSIADPMVSYFYGPGGVLSITPPPANVTLKIYISGYVFDKNTNWPIQGVEVALKNSLVNYTVETDRRGYFKLELLPDKYDLVFSKEGYQDKELIDVSVNATKTLTVYMEKEIIIHNRKPVIDISPIEVIVGEEITLNSDDFASDPDEDQLDVSYSGWNTYVEDILNDGSSYTTTEGDIGTHEVVITVSDGEFDVTETLVIDIIAGYYDMILYEGFNLISYPFENVDTNFTAFDLLESLGGSSKITSIAYYNNIADKYITAGYDLDGNAIVEDDFTISLGQGYVLYVKEDIEKTVINRYDGAEHPLDLSEGLNLVGLASCREGYTSYEFLLDLKIENNVDSIYRYDPFWGDWESTYWLNGSATGDCFPILKGEGYYVQIKESD